MDSKLLNCDKYPIVKFGKYKGKSVKELLADKQYVEWLKQQPWFNKQNFLYNVIMNKNDGMILTEENKELKEENKQLKERIKKLEDYIKTINTDEPSFD